MNRSSKIVQTASPKAECPYCRCPMEFPPSDVPGRVVCPNCGESIEMDATLTGLGAFLGSTRRRVLLTLSAVLLLALIVLGVVYRRFLLSGIDIIGEATGGRTTAILAVAGALLLVVWLLLWLLFPVLMYFAMRDLRKRSAELDLTTRLCLRHLARLTPRSAIETERPPAPPRPAATATAKPAEAISDKS